MAQQIVRIHKVPHDFRRAGLTTRLEKRGVLVAERFPAPAVPKIIAVA